MSPAQARFRRAGTMVHEPSQAQRALLVVYALIFYTAAVELAIVPLLPRFTEEFHLSTVEAGALLASMNFTVMLAAIPLGQLSDRIGARQMTIGAATVYALAAVGQGFASSYGMLLASWALCGVGVAIVASCSLAWLSDLLPTEQRATALGGAATVSGVGVIVGPLFGGIVVDGIGRGPAFLFAAVFATALAVVAHRRTTDTRRDLRSLPLHATLLAVRREPLVLGGLVLVGLLGLVFGTVSVLASLALGENGLSNGEVGLAFSASAAVFVAASWIVARRGDRPVTLRVAAMLAAAQAVVLLIPIANLSTLALVMFLFLRTPIWATSSTISYPLTSEGAHRAELGRGAIFGLLNLVWGVAAVAGPVIGGAIAQTVGDRWAFAALAIVCAAAAGLLRRLERSERRFRATGRVTDIAEEFAR